MAWPLALRCVREAFQHRHERAGYDGAIALQVSFWKAGAGVEILKSAREGAPIASLSTRERAGARSLRLAQWIVTGFVQSLNFVAVEALIPNLQPSAEGSGRA